MIHYSLIAISLIVLGRIFWENREILLEFDWQIQPRYFGLSLIFFGVDIFLGTLAWHHLAKTLGNFNNWRMSTKIIWSANLAHRLPGPAHIASRALQYEQQGVKKRVISFISLVELIYFIMTGTIFSFVVLTGQIAQGIETQIDLRILLVLALGISLLLTNPLILKKGFSRFQTDLFRFNWGDSLLLFGIYVLFWIFGGLSLFYLVNTFTPLSFTSIVAIIGFWSLSNTLSLISQITIPLAAVRDVSLVFLLSLIVPPPIAILVALISRITWMGGELSTALASFWL
ncbi:MAG: hypothetical protein QNJ45_09485 [Ardenticatenaceae bacterium]|nr:hypothetical protein [Ardenticatenaceae bacterium]